MIPVAVGQVVAVEIVKGVPQVVVDLREHTIDGAPLRASCIVCAPVHGIGSDGESFGSWRLPLVGADVLCFFPGVSLEGVLGDELDTGYVLGVVPSQPEPLPENDVAQPVASNRWVTTTPLHTSVSFWMRGVQAAFRAAFEGVVSILLKAASTITAESSVTVNGEDDVTVALSNGAILTVSSDGRVVVDCDDIRLGAGTLARLLNETALATYNGHTHVQSGGVLSTAAPTQQMVVGTDTTQETRAA